MRAPDATRSANFAAGMGFALVTAVGWGLNWPVPKSAHRATAAVDNVRIGISAFGDKPDVDKGMKLRRLLTHCGHEAGRNTALQ